MAKVSKYPRNGRQYSCREDQSAGAPGCKSLRQDRGIQSARLGQGPPGAWRHRGSRALRRAQAGADGHRGDERQHRHRAGDGVRPEGLSAGADDGRDIQRRAAQADAVSRRQGGAHAGSATGRRHGGEGRGARQNPWLVPDPPVRKRSQSRHALAHHRARNHCGFCRRAAGLLGHRLRHRRHAQGRRARLGEGEAGHQDRRLRAAGRAIARKRHPPASATPTVQPRQPIRPSNPTRCKAGLPISFRS